MAMALAAAISLPVHATAPREGFEDALARADEHARADRHADALETYAEAYEAMPEELRVSGVGEFVVLEAGLTAIADFAARGDQESLARAQSLLRRFITAVKTAGPGVESVPIDAARQRLTELEALMPEPEPEVEPFEESSDEAREPVLEAAPSATESDSPTQERTKLNSLEVSGITLMIVGGIATIPGVVLVVRKPTIIVDDPERVGERINTRPLGGLVLATGGTLLVTGAVLFGIGRGRAKRERAVALHPWFEIGGGGLGLSGRF